MKNYKILKKTKYFIDKDYTIYKRIVKNKISGYYELHISCNKDFLVYQSTTFASYKNALKILKYT